MDGEFGIIGCKLLYLECISNEVLLLVQGIISNLLGKTMKKDNIRNEIMPFAATDMYLDITVLSEVRKRKANTM